MKKIIIFVLLLMSCEENQRQKVIINKPDSTKSTTLAREFYIRSKIIFDDRGCEYLLVYSSDGVAITHLPKCRNHF